MPTRKKRQSARKASSNGRASKHTLNGQKEKPKTPELILVVDIGGTKVKLLAAGETAPRKATTGKDFSPQKLVATVTKLAQGWKYDAITIGAPCLVGMNGPQSEPGNLGTGWVGFDYEAAFGKPVRVINDAVMQALGSYEHGRMFFVGLGTGIGSALIAENVIVPMEIGDLPFDGERSISQALSKSALQKFGKKVWRRALDRLVPMLMSAFVADYVVLGGGNAKYVKKLPAGARLGHNLTAFRGGVRIWDETAHWTLAIPANSSKPLSPLAKVDAKT